jgi:putative membrane protein
MKKISVIMTMVLSAWLFQACTGTKNGSTTDSTATKDATAVNDTPKNTSANMSAAADSGDVKFAAEAASGGMTEVTLGKIAQDKGVNARVKKFGSMMVMDHSKANDSLKALAARKNITLPAAPNAKDQATIDKLSKLSGKAFDDAYVSDMIDDHKHDVQAFQDASNSLKDPDLKAFATKTLPVLKTHLDAINGIHDSMKK